jgi:uncharacterized protein with von Willebrand factor type A (vWA) domain
VSELLPLLAVFQELRQCGFPLGIAEYELLLEALACGVPAGTPEELCFLCQTLWAKSHEEQEIVAAVLGVLLPEEPRSEPLPVAPGPPPSPAPAPPAPVSKPVAGTVTPPAGIPRPSASAQLASRLGLARAGAEAAGALAASLVRLQGRPVRVHPGLNLEGDLPITRRQMNRAWRYYRRMQRRGMATEIDVPATVAEMVRTGGVFLGPVLIPRRVNCARILILHDEGGSMIPFRRLTRPLLESALQVGLARVEVGWFHDVPGATLYLDSTLSRPVKLERLAAPFRDAGVLIVSDAGAARGQLNRARVNATAEALRRLRVFSQNVAWLNPTPPARWSRSTAGEIVRETGVPMFPLTRRGLDTAVEVLRGRARAGGALV